MRLLLVEDDPDMSRALSRALEKRGHHVTACFDGAEALRLMKDDRLEVAILDLSIPVVDGLHVLQRLRALMRRPGHAVPRDRLLRMVFNDDESAQVDALDVVVHRLRKKLGVSNAEVMTLRGVGYLLRERSSAAPGA